MKEIKNYPKLKRHPSNKLFDRLLFVRYTVQITEQIRAKAEKEKLTYEPLTVGKFMEVNVVKGGYQYLPMPAIFYTLEEGESHCKFTNKLQGFTKKRIIEILDWSFNTIQTHLPKSIKTVKQAKSFLISLYVNGESYHCEDNAQDCFERINIAEATQLNKLMTDIYNLPGNDGRHHAPMIFDPCEFVLSLHDQEQNE